jgi:hypothetical protein
MDHGGIDELCEYIESRTAIEEKSARKSAPVSMKVLRVVVLSLVERIGPRLKAQDERIAGLASAERLVELQRRIHALERRLREVERA